MKGQFQVLSVILLFFLIYSAISTYLQMLLNINEFLDKNNFLEDFIILYNLREIYISNYFYNKDFVYAIPIKIYYYTNLSYFIVEINQTIGKYNLFCNMTYLDCNETNGKLIIGFNHSLNYLYFFLGPTNPRKADKPQGNYIIGIFPYSLITNNETFYNPFITKLFSDYIINSYYKDFMASDKEERVFITS